MRLQPWAAEGCVWKHPAPPWAALQKAACGNVPHTALGCRRLRGGSDRLGGSAAAAAGSAAAAAGSAAAATAGAGSDAPATLGCRRLRWGTVPRAPCGLTAGSLHGRLGHSGSYIGIQVPTNGLRRCTVIHVHGTGDAIVRRHLGRRTGARRRQRWQLCTRQAAVRNARALGAQRGYRLSDRSGAPSSAVGSLELAEDDDPCPCLLFLATCLPSWPSDFFERAGIASRDNHAVDLRR